MIRRQRYITERVNISRTGRSNCENPRRIIRERGNGD